MDDDSQISVPPSFIAVCSDARGRLLATPAAVRERYELCEDLACSLVEQAQTIYHGGASSEEGVLSGIHAALAASEVGVSPVEARWVTLRLAELLGWRSPELPQA